MTKPWKLDWGVMDGVRAAVITSGDDVVVVLKSCSDETANLLVAAPELLDALKWLIKVPSRLSGEQLAAANMAIAKAEGKE